MVDRRVQAGESARKAGPQRTDVAEHSVILYSLLSLLALGLTYALVGWKIGLRSSELGVSGRAVILHRGKTLKIHPKCTSEAKCAFSMKSLMESLMSQALPGQESH